MKKLGSNTPMVCTEACDRGWEREKNICTIFAIYVSIVKSEHQATNHNCYCTTSAFIINDLTTYNKKSPIKSA